MVSPNIKAGDDAGDGAAGEFQRAGDMRVDLDRQPRSHQRVAGGDAFGEGHARRSRDPRHWSHQMDERRQVVGAHVEERSCALLIEDAGVGVPAFRSMSHEDGCCRYWRPDQAVVDGFASRLQAAAEEGIGRAAQAQVGRRRRFDDFGAIVARNGQRLFAVGMLARFNDLQRDFGMRGRDGQVDDDVDFVAREQVIDAAGGQSVHGGERFRPLSENIGAGGDLDDIKWRAAFNIRRRDIAGADEANVQGLHGVSYAGDPPSRPYNSIARGLCHISNRPSGRPAGSARGCSSVLLISMCRPCSDDSSSASMISRA